VAWLRHKANQTFAWKGAYRILADAIERGDHTVLTRGDRK
jgi:hypothetical protein